MSALSISEPMKTGIRIIMKQRKKERKMMKPEEMEEKFIAAFIRPSRRERLTYELSHPEKRYRGLERFCHTAEELLDPEKIILKGTGFGHMLLFGEFLKEHASDPCLIISPDPTLDGIEASLQEALCRVSMSADASVIISEAFALTTEEGGKHGTMQYLSVL